MTVRQQPAVWRWPTASPLWSRGSRCKRMRFSCWSLLWLMLSADSICLRSSKPWAHAGDPPKVTYSTYIHYIHVFYKFMSQLFCGIKKRVSRFYNITVLWRVWLQTTLPGLNPSFGGILSFLFFYLHDVSIKTCFVLFSGWLAVNLLSFLLLDHVVLLNVLCFMYRPCFDEKVSLSRQQCWEPR